MEEYLLALQRIASVCAVDCGPSDYSKDLQFIRAIMRMYLATRMVTVQGAPDMSALLIAFREDHRSGAWRRSP